MLREFGVNGRAWAEGAQTHPLQSCQTAIKCSFLSSRPSLLSTQESAIGEENPFRFRLVRSQARCYRPGVSRIHEARLKLRGELEAAPALRRFGSGSTSGVLGLVFGVGGLLLVLSLRAPGLFAMPEIRGLHGNHWFRLGSFSGRVPARLAA